MTDLITPRALFSHTYLSLNLVQLEIAPFDPRRRKAHPRIKHGVNGWGSTMTATNHDDQLGEINPTMLNELNCTFGVETCESAVCVRIESRIESGVNIRIRIESFQLQRILITTRNTLDCDQSNYSSRIIFSPTYG